MQRSLRYSSLLLKNYQHHRSMSTKQQHWMDRFEGLQEWLDARNQRAWLNALLRDQTKRHPQLSPHTQLIERAVQNEYQRLLQEDHHRVVDSRSLTHLQVASLAAATHKVLSPLLRDEDAVMDIISQHMGSKTTPLLKLLLRFTGWLGLPSDAFTTLRRRLTGLQMDYGQGFTTDLKSTDNEVSLTVNTCFYKQFFDNVGVPQLTGTTCCSHDRFWIETGRRKGVVAGLVACQASGDVVCCFQVLKLPAVLKTSS